MNQPQIFADLPAVAHHLRQQLDENKDAVLLYAYNGTGKTRLSMAFKGAQERDVERDTLYFNAFTEDLFQWDNDLNDNSDRRLVLNSDSRFFAGLAELEMDTRIRPLLQRYADFDFRIDTEQWVVRFSRMEGDQLADNIKVSRGEENIFVWCFFLAIVQLAIDGAEAYEWVKYIYIDDPISSLDEHNAIAVGSHLAQMLKSAEGKRLKVVISSHHPLFFNVMHNEMDARRSKKVSAYFLAHVKPADEYSLTHTNDTPFFHHVAILTELYKAAQSGELYTYHFNMLRTVLEKSASFHGFSSFSACLSKDKDDPDGILYARLVNILSHGNYSLYEPRKMQDENKAYFKKMLDDFLKHYQFNPQLFSYPAEG